MKKLSDFIKTNWFTIAIFLIALLGIFLRIQIYLFCRPLWMDEAYLANNLFSPHPILDNMMYGQAAPPLFKLISLLNVKIFGMSNYSLRLFPLLCGLCSIFIFIRVIKIILPSKLTQIAAAVLFSINYLLIYYSSELKQYSTDVLCSLCLILLTLKINIKTADKKTIILLSLLYGSVFWISHASLFILSSIFIFYLIYNIKEYKKIILMFTPAAISFTVFWFLHLKTISNSSYMHQFWTYNFLNSKEHLEYIINDTIPVFFFPNIHIILILTVMLLGIILLYKKEPKASVLIGLPAIILIIASFLSLYPITFRLALFMVPLCIIYYSSILLPKKSKVTAVFAILLFICGSSKYVYYYPHIILSKDIWVREVFERQYNPLNIKYLKNYQIRY